MASIEPTSGFVKPDSIIQTAQFTDFSTVPTNGYSLLIRAKRHGRWWMLKGLKEQYRHDAVYQVLLQKEYEITSQLQHPMVVSVSSLEDVEGLGPCIVMEWIKGQTLREWLAEGHHTKKQRRHVADMLIEALAYVHSRQTQHRDLKPSNIMLTHDGLHLKLIDFGLSDTDSHAILKAPAGTEGYMAPEGPSDIYSLGCVLRELRIGGASAIVIRKCCAPLPQRYTDMATIQRDLHRTWQWSMRILLVLGLALLTAGAWLCNSLLKAYDIIDFADLNVKAICVDHWDTNGDGELSRTEAAAVTTLDGAFKEDTDITSFDELQYFTGLTTIDANAFFNCPKLESINLPKSITNIGKAAFCGCGSLKSIDLSGLTVTIDAEAFLESGLEELFIPATATLQGWSNFGWCNSLKTVIVEYKGKLPHNDLFRACAQLETVVLPKASAMKFDTFVDCPKLKSVTFTSGDAGNVPYCRNFAGTPDDVLFNVPSGTAESFLKMGYWNLSDLSALPTVKAGFEAEAVAIETMVNGISDGDKTTLANVISEARTEVVNADSYASVLEQLAAIKTAAMTFIAGATLTENTDITSAAITNADFDNFTIGWKHGRSQFGTYCTGNLINDDVVMDKFIEAWDPSEGNLFSQTIKSLPAGIYRMEADISTKPWDGTDVEGVILFAENNQTDVVTGANQPQHFSLQFSHNIVGDCTMGIRIAATYLVNYVALDNVRLYYVGKAADIP